MDRNCKNREDEIRHAVNLEELREIEESVPMTLGERDRLRRWVYRGNDPSANPWRYRYEDGREMHYIDAYHHHLRVIWGEFYKPYYIVGIAPYEERKVKNGNLFE